MGFMAGFGSAFANSFNAENDRIAQEKQDMFRMQYSDYISQRDYRQKIDLENKKAANLAKTLVASTPGQPPEAWQGIYDYLVNGGTAEGAQKMLENNQAIVENSNTTKPGEGATASDPQTADPRDNLTQAASNSVDAQMTASGMTPPASGGLFGNVKQGLHDVFNSGSQSQRHAEQARQKVMATAGVDQQQYDQTMNPSANVPGEPVAGSNGVSIKWQPKGPRFQDLDAKANNLGDAQALALWVEDPANNATPEQIQYAQNKLAKFKELKSQEIRQNAFSLDPSKAPQRGMIRKKDGTGYEDQFVTAEYPDGDFSNPVYRDAQGNEVDPKTVAPVGAAQEADMKAVADEASETMKPYQEEKTNLKNFIRTSNDYIKLMKDTKGKYDGKAMDITGDVSQFVDRWRRAGVNIADLVMPKGNIEDANSAIAELDSAEKKVRDQLASGKLIDAISQNAAKATLIDIQGTKLAYQMAAAANGSTKGISNADFQNYKNVVSGGGNPATAAKALAMSIRQAQKNVGDMEGNIKTGKGKTSYYKGKYPNAPTGFDMGPGFDDEIKNDPEMVEAMKNINYDASLDENPGAQIDTNPDTPTWLPKATNSDGTPITPQQYQRLSDRGKELLKKKFGGQ